MGLVTGFGLVGAGGGAAATAAAVGLFSGESPFDDPWVSAGDAAPAFGSGDAVEADVAGGVGEVADGTGVFSAGGLIGVIDGSAAGSVAVAGAGAVEFAAGPG